MTQTGKILYLTHWFPVPTPRPLLELKPNEAKKMIISLNTVPYNQLIETLTALVEIDYQQDQLL